MARLIDATVEHLAPWRGADWRLMIGEGAALILGGAYFLTDDDRAEFILGAVISIVLVLDGVRNWYQGVRHLRHGQARELTLIRGSLGLIIGAFVIGLSITGQITTIAIRGTLGVGLLLYGLLGLWFATPWDRRHEGGWGATAFDFVLIALGLLFLYRVATATPITLLLSVVGWATVALGVAVIVAAVIRRYWTPDQPEGQGDQRP